MDEQAVIHLLMDLVEGRVPETGHWSDKQIAAWQRALREAADSRLMALLGPNPAACQPAHLVLDPSGRILQADARARRILLRDAGTLADNLLEEFLASDSRGQWRQCLAGPSAGERLFSAQLAAPLGAAPCRIQVLPLEDHQRHGQLLVQLTTDAADPAGLVGNDSDAEIKFRTIFDNVSDGISIFERFPGRLERRLMDCNAAYAAMAGRSRDELMAVKDIRTIQKHDHTPMDSWEYQRAVEAERHYDGVFSWIRPDHKENVIEYRALPRRIGGRILVFGIDRDITDRVRAEKLIHLQRDLSARLNTIADLSNALRCVVTNICSISEIDAAFVYLRHPETGVIHLLAHHGLSEADIRGLQHFSPDSHFAHMLERAEPPLIRINQFAEFAEVLTAGGMRAGAVLPLAFEGVVTGALCIASSALLDLSSNTSETLESLAAWLAGVMVHYRTDERLRESEAVARVLLDANPDGIMLTDEHLVILDLNRTARQWYLNPEGTAVGLPAVDVLPASLSDRLGVHARTVKDRGQPTGWEDAWNDRIMEHSLHPVADAEGRITRLALYSRDVTQARRFQDELLQKERELKDKASSLEATNTALKVVLDHREQEKLESEKNLSANMKKLIFPSLEKLQATELSPEQEIQLDILGSNLARLSSSFARRLTRADTGLTTTELEVAEMVRVGKSTKEIARLLGMSPSTVSFHRNNIRTKLGITNRKVNLRSYLQSLHRD